MGTIAGLERGAASLFPMSASAGRGGPGEERGEERACSVAPRVHKVEEECTCSVVGQVADIFAEKPVNVAL